MQKKTACQAYFIGFLIFRRYQQYLCRYFGNPIVCFDEKTKDRIKDPHRKLTRLRRGSNYVISLKVTWLEQSVL